MKTITIPKSFGFPTLEVIINGKTYTLKSGEEISVEDHVASVIENAIALAPKIGVPRNKIAQIAEGSITELTAEDLAGITKLKRLCFYSCGSLISVTIPNGIVSIEDKAFAFCPNLESIYLPETPPTLSNVDAFGQVDKDICTFYCKTQESLEAYQTAENWSTMTGTYTFVVK